MQTLISLIIPTRGRPRYLKDLLFDLKEQSLSPHLYEVIVVDNMSEKSVESIVHRYRKDFTNLIYIHEPIAGLHNARHSGYRASRSPLLLFADDDIRPDPNWIEAVVTAFTEENCEIVVGRTLPSFEAPRPTWLGLLFRRSPYGEYLDLYSLFDGGPVRKNISSEFAYGCNFAIRKHSLERAKGFDPDGMPKELRIYRGGGETTLAKRIDRLGGKILYEPKATVYHRIPKERLVLRYVYERSRNGGTSLSFIQLRENFRSPLVKSLLRFALQIVPTLIRSVRAGGVAYILRFIGFWLGFLEHQVAFRTSPDVRRWVRKQDYLETCQPGK